jgi:hypothetical protein
MLIKRIEKMERKLYRLNAVLIEEEEAANKSSVLRSEYKETRKRIVYLLTQITMLKALINRS